METADDEFETVPMGSNSTDNGDLLPTSSMANSYDADKERVRLEPEQLTPRTNFMTRLRGDVDAEQSTAPLVAYCFMTGFMYVDHYLFIYLFTQYS